MASSLSICDQYQINYIWLFCQQRYPKLQWGWGLQIACDPYIFVKGGPGIPVTPLDPRLTFLHIHNSLLAKLCRWGWDPKPLECEQTTGLPTWSLSGTAGSSLPGEGGGVKILPRCTSYHMIDGLYWYPVQGLPTWYPCTTWTTPDFRGIYYYQDPPSRSMVDFCCFGSGLVLEMIELTSTTCIYVTIYKFTQTQNKCISFVFKTSQKDYIVGHILILPPPPRLCLEAEDHL